MDLFRRILCFLGFHSGSCYDGAYRCLYCGYTDFYREAEGLMVKKMSPKTFREIAELALKNYRQRIEREET